MKTLLNKFKKFFSKMVAFKQAIALDNRIKEHFNNMEKGAITVKNWRDRLKILGHEAEIEIAEDIFGTPQDTKDLNLDHIDAGTGAWVYIALDWMHTEQEFYDTMNESIKHQENVEKEKTNDKTTT